ncbi:MAG TPA: 30S ribosome-binding factor RbfA [Phycisphaerales bacterium]
MSRRTEQLASVLREEIQRVIDRGVNDPRVSGLVTVTEVRVSEDMADATIMISVLPAEKQELSLHGIRAAASHIRNQAGKNVRTRKLPRFHFDADNRSKKQAEVMAALRKVREDQEARGITPDSIPDPDLPSPRDQEPTA